MATKSICSIPECGKPEQARSYCHMHYRRWRIHGDPNVTKAPQRLACSIEGCEKVRIGHGYCSKHYQRFMRFGDANFHARTSPGEALEFLIGTVFEYSGDECLTWPFSSNSQGYGTVRFNDTRTLVGRIVCEKVYGAPPSREHEAAHSCGNGHLACCTKKHLRWATRTENQRDRLIHGTTSRGENCGMAKLTEIQVHEIRALRGVKLQRDIAAQYGIGHSTVSMIQTRKAWPWLE